MASTRVIKNCSYQTLSRYSGERARNVDEFRFKQRANIHSHRLKEKLSHILEKRHTLNIEEMIFFDRDDEQQREAANYSSVILSQAIAQLYRAICYHHGDTDTVNALLGQSWPLIMQGLSVSNLNNNMDTITLLKTVQSYKPDCMKLLIQHGLLYKIRDLFRQDDTRTSSIGLLCYLVAKTPSLISYILTIMLTDNTCALFEEIFLMCGWSDIEQLILFYSLTMSSLLNKSIVQLYSNIDSKFILQELLTPDIIKHIANYCIQSTNKTNIDLIRTGLWILSTTAYLASISTDDKWSAKTKIVLDDINLHKKLKKLLSSAKRSARKADATSLSSSHVQELNKLCQEHFDLFLDYLANIKCRL